MSGSRNEGLRGPGASPATPDDVDQALRLKQLAQPKACYACYKRKVKCDHGSPCGTCVKRGHPDICTYAFEPKSKRRAGLSSEREHAADSSVPGSDKSPVNIQSADSEQQASGDGSLVNILRHRSTATRVLGLENTLAVYPFSDARTPQERWASLLKVIPRQNEISEYFPPYRSFVHPFNPIIVDIDKFESNFCRYLDALAAGELKDQDRISEKWSNEKPLAHVALLLATLAAGSQFSILDPVKRSDLCADFARRAFQVLRLANFLFRPSLDTIQALLVIGNLLENKGQSEGAWALLGTTTRLAQSMGLHRQGLTQSQSDLEIKAKAIWASIVWQDTFLSLVLGQVPIALGQNWSVLPPDAPSSQNLLYAEVVHGFVRVVLELLVADQSSDLDRRQEMLSGIDSYYERASPYLRNLEHCETLQQRLEHFGLRIHLSTCVLTVCRPAVKNASENSEDNQLEMLAKRAEEALINVQTAFLQFQTLSVVPLRTWSMAQTVLRATLILCMWRRTRWRQDCRQLQQQVIDAFTTAIESSYVDSSGKVPAPHCHWLSERHLFAIIALQKATNRSPSPAPREILTTSPQSPNPGSFIGDSDGLPDLNAGENFDASFLAMIGDGLDSDGIPSNWSMDGLSPVSYVDNILSGSLPNFTEFNGFF
ncbi:hypothetical protein GQ53DRAFT_732486 [Thozetella sp. PMI_491]|nr:hypothetical protein GQ53DRAFT_732486 [Thozetella sp. PMI_491]